MIGNWLHTMKARAAFAHFGRHDLEAFSASWAEDVVFVYPGPTSWAGRFAGKKAMKGWIQRYMDYFPRIEFAVKRICVENPFGLRFNVVAAEWDVAVTNRDGKDFTYGGITVFHIEQARVVLATDYIFCTPEYREALGEGGGGRQATAS
ncbi:MAG TPA: nuclear transport factor 2 family protein [Anaeromyxobacteraceae bacterium]|nr:nuclear transport factor 2 family protein [Anaeromyxobacteraceae bacterium]